MSDLITADLNHDHAADVDRLLRHHGDATAPLDRWRAHLRTVSPRGWSAVRDYAPEVMRLVADPRVLFQAAVLLRAGGPKTPGPNDVRLEVLTGDELWQMCRALSAAVTADTYRPGREWVVWVKKAGPGRRPIVLMDAQDRVVQKAVALVLRPMLDVLLDPLSFANRPQRTREQAVAAGGLIAAGGYPVWALHDLKDAFRRVPVKRLLNVFSKLLTCPRLRALLGRVLPPRSRAAGGIKQGGPLSPLALEVYLWHVLDAPLRRAGLDVRLIRWVDDLALAARSDEDIVRADALVRRLLVPAGMAVKDGLATAVIDIRDEPADWLGYRVDLVSSGLRARLGAKAFDRLGRRFVLAHAKGRPAERAVRVLTHWVGQLGPCHRWEDRPAVLGRAIAIARSFGFEEGLSTARLADGWADAAARWEATERAVRATPGYLAAGPLAAPTPTSVVW